MHTSVLTSVGGADPDHYVDDGQAAAILGLSRSYLRQMRVRGGGPKFASFGRAIRYRVSSLHEWAEGKISTSTSDREAA